MFRSKTIELENKTTKIRSKVSDPKSIITGTTRCEAITDNRLAI